MRHYNKKELPGRKAGRLFCAPKGALLFAPDRARGVRGVAPWPLVFCSLKGCAGVTGLRPGGLLFLQPYRSCGVYGASPRYPVVLGVATF